MDDDFRFPFKPGDWVMTESGRVAKVKTVDKYRDEITFDLIIYNSRGDKVGRRARPWVDPARSSRRAPSKAGSVE